MTFGNSEVPINNCKQLKHIHKDLYGNMNNVLYLDNG